MFRLAVFQSPSALNGPQERLTWLEASLRKISGRGVDLVLLPELFMTGYNMGSNLEAWAEASDGPFAKAVGDLAARYGTAIHYGYPERAGETIYNAAQCIGPDRCRLGGHRKLILPPGFEADHFSHGAGCALFTYRGLRIATLICFDIEFPEIARHAAVQGADLLLVPTALGSQWGWVGRTMVPTRGFENGIFLAYANHSGCENGMSFLGESFVSTPDGRELARAGAGEELLTVEIDAAIVTAAQARLPYLSDRLKIALP